LTVHRCREATPFVWYSGCISFKFQAGYQISD